MGVWSWLWRGWREPPPPEAEAAPEPAGPVTTARFTPEGGFAPAADYAWSEAAEAEFAERLSRLGE